MERYDLPNGWTWAKFSDFIASLKNGIYKPEQFYGAGIPCLRMYNIENGELIWRDIKLMSLSQQELVVHHTSYDG